MPASADDLDIVPMDVGDLDAVTDIERQSHRSPWPAQLFVQDLARDWARIDLARSRSDRGRIVAFCNYWLVHDEVHLLNLAIHPDYRRRGIGTRLIQHLLEVAHAHRCRYVTLEVRRSNTAAQTLYQVHGFEAVGVRPKYYADDGEDAIVMTRKLPG